jgi:phosphoglycolate phosphatase
MPIDKSKIQAIFFDVDGTLRDTDDQYVDRVSNILRPLRFILPRKDPQSTARFLVMRMEGPINGLINFADILGLDAALHRFFEFFSPRKNKADNNNYILIEGVEGLLKNLVKRYPLAIVTARSEKSTIEFLEGTNLSQYFEHVASALTTSRGKPRPDPIYWAARQMNIEPEKCLMVGDTVVDIIAGKSAGAQTIGVLSGFGEEKELRQKGADLILPSVAEIEDLLN